MGSIVEVFDYFGGVGKGVRDCMLLIYPSETFPKTAKGLEMDTARGGA